MAALEVVGAGNSSETVRLMHGGSVYGSTNPFLILIDLGFIAEDRSLKLPGLGIKNSRS